MAEDLTDAALAAPPPPLAPEHAAANDNENLEARLWDAIQNWRAAHIAGGPIARVTECWNHLEASLQHLATSILKEI